MNTKLTLRIDEQLIESAKRYSARTGKSVSKLVADFFAVIQNDRSGGRQPISPTVESIKGILKNSRLTEDDYKNYLVGKYL